MRNTNNTLIRKNGRNDNSSINLPTLFLPKENLSVFSCQILQSCVLLESASNFVNGLEYA